MYFFCHFHEDFHWSVTPKSFIIEISLWYMLFMVPNVFPLNPGHWKTYKKTQRSQTSVKGLRKEVLHCESLKLAAILDAILDFEKCSRVSSIHQADFVYVMSEAAEPSEKKTISVRSGYAHLAAWLFLLGVLLCAIAVFVIVWFIIVHLLQRRLLDWPCSSCWQPFVLDRRGWIYRVICSSRGEMYQGQHHGCGGPLDCCWLPRQQ